MSKRVAIIGIFAIVFIGCAYAYSTLSRHTSVNTPPSSTVSSKNDVSAPTTVPSSPGRFIEYSSDALSAPEYSTTILFFYAGWCPECRGFEKAINAGTIPTSTQILRVDYDNSSDLKQKYGVTIQSTFVRIKSDGALQAKWVGYGRDKSIQTILDNTQ